LLPTNENWPNFQELQRLVETSAIPEKILAQMPNFIQEAKDTPIFNGAVAPK